MPAQNIFFINCHIFAVPQYPVYNMDADTGKQIFRTTEKSRHGYVHNSGENAIKLRRMSPELKVRDTEKIGKNTARLSVWHSGNSLT